MQQNKSELDIRQPENKWAQLANDINSGSTQVKPVIMHMNEAMTALQLLAEDGSFVLNNLDVFKPATSGVVECELFTEGNYVIDYISKEEFGGDNTGSR